MLWILSKRDELFFCSPLWCYAASIPSSLRTLLSRIWLISWLTVELDIVSFCKSDGVSFVSPRNTLTSKLISGSPSFRDLFLSYLLWFIQVLAYWSCKILIIGLKALWESTLIKQPWVWYKISCSASMCWATVLFRMISLKSQAIALGQSKGNIS